MIRNIQLRHAGKYTCAVQTKVDSISIAVDLVVRGKPLPRTSIVALLSLRMNTLPFRMTTGQIVQLTRFQNC